jgi:AAA+ superfamily predicted ATPase
VSDHLTALQYELDWLGEVLSQRIATYFAPADADVTRPCVTELPQPPALQRESAWTALVQRHGLILEERLLIALALAPHLKPQLLEPLLFKNSVGRRFPELGGHVSEDEVEPTGETLAFLLGGSHLTSWARAATIAHAEHRLFREDVLRLGSPRGGLTHAMKAPVRLAPGLLDRLVLAVASTAQVELDFPAQPLQTGLQWQDLILHRGTLQQLSEVLTFVRHGERLMRDWAMADRLRPGHRALFFGPPGTGKTLSAALLGKITGRDVFRIDLSLVVSKYIGETEKNLARVFDRAEARQWILFFDEADALFGRRTEANDVAARYANQETAYLLQRIETFRGIAILASNLRENMDDAFMRRFESVVYFPMPSADERLQLWKRGLPPKAELSADVDLAELARNHELSGGGIMNVIRHVALTVIADGERAITRDDLRDGVRRELAKEGRR